MTIKMYENMQKNMRKTTTTTNKTLKFISIVLCCCFITNVVQAQQLQSQEQQQQQQQKYNQLKYQMQHQHQYDYQQQQHYQEQYRQQYEQQQEQLRQSASVVNNQSPFHALLPITLPLKQQPAAKQQLTRYKKQEDTINSPTISTNTQLLQTSASLVVAGGQKEYYEPVADAQATMKRRPGNRKRKRRPQISTTESEDWRANIENDNKNISTRPITSGVKRRQTFTNQEEKLQDKPQKVGLPLTEHDRSNRRYKPTEATTATSVRSELKNILKNSVGNMSLSEILQQKNLSLDDLLKGKQNALLALQTTASAPTSVVKTVNNIRRLSTLGATSASLSEPITKPNTNFNENNEGNAKNKLKFPALQRLKLFGTSSRVTSTTERTITSTTNTPTIIVSSTTTTRLPLYKKRLQQRPTLKPPGLFKPILTSTTYTNKALENTSSEENVKNFDEFPVIEEPIKKFSSTTTTTSTTKIPTTTTTTTTTTKITTTMMPSTSVAIKEPKTTGVNYMQNESNADTEEQEEEHNLKTNSIEHDDTLSTHTQTNNIINTTTMHANYADNISSEAEVRDDDELENFFVEPKKSAINITPRIDFVATKNSQNHFPEFNDGVDDRTDILELIEDRRSGNRLFKILEQRNMTLDELIEHRKRGSSQLHLKTIVQNQAGLFPGQKIILQDNMDIVTAFENFPHFNLMNLKSVRPDDIKTDSQGASYFTSIIDIEPTDEVYKDGTSNESGGTGFFPSWKTLALASLTNKPIKEAATKRNPFYLPQQKLLLNNVPQDLDDVDSEENNSNQNIADIKEKIKVPTVVDDDVVEAIENEVARAHDLLDLELSGHGFQRSPAAAASISQQLAHNSYTQMPAGIRSAIVASAAIVLTSLATFMVIFVVCRWKQHQKRKSSYMKTYNAMKSKMPALSINSCGSSVRHVDEMVSGIATITQPGKRQNDLVFSRYNESTTPTSVTGATTLLGNCGGLRKQSLDATLDKCHNNRKTQQHHHHHHHHGFAGSMNSLALSLQSTHNDTDTPSRKLSSMDTMDPNSPEVQEYLFDALRNSF